MKEGLKRATKQMGLFQQPARLPSWLARPLGPLGPIHGLATQFRARRLVTVCEEARCPNLNDCWAQKTATFMILGRYCTRKCGFCAVETARPQTVDPGEPERIAAMVCEMGLDHTVVTAVARDDLPDGGAAHFAEVVRAVRRAVPKTTIEVLTSDFKGHRESIALVCDASPDVFNHNIETVRSLTPRVRHRATYDRSLAVLAMAKEMNPLLVTKSGLMVGLGEGFDEVVAAMRDLRDARCDLLTIGQYLQPTRGHLAVIEYVRPEVFQEYGRVGRGLGFRSVFAGPLVRSSFHAGEVLSGSVREREFYGV